MSPFPRSLRQAFAEVTGREVPTLVALVAAGGLALHVAWPLTRMPRPTSNVVSVARYERGLAPMRAALGSGDRVALLAEEDGAWPAAQYVLAPATVLPLRRTSCTEDPLARCASGATHLLVLGATSADGEPFAARFGLVPVASSRLGVLYVRGSR